GYIFAVVDSGDRNVNSVWDVAIDVVPPVCTPGAALSCDDAQTLRYCNHLGSAEETMTCAGSCDDSSGTAHCTQPAGDICADAIDATGGGSFSVDMGKMSNQYDMFNATCIKGYSQAEKGMPS